MELHRADSAVVADDPFWAVVRRRHPDLTVVLLPDEPPDDRPPTPPDEVRAATERLAQAWAVLAPVLAQPAATPPSVRWAHREQGAALVLDKALPGAGPELLAALAQHLGEQGWRLRPGTRAGHPVLQATDGVLGLTGRTGAAATTISVAAPPVRLPDSRRREVRAALVALLAEPGAPGPSGRGAR